MKNDFKNSNVMAEVLGRLYGDKTSPAALPPKAIRTIDLHDLSLVQRYTAKAYLDARHCKDAALEVYKAASQAEQSAYANLSDIEIELEAMEKESGLTRQTKFLTIEEDPDGDVPNLEAAIEKADAAHE